VTSPSNPLAALRSRSYLALLVLAAIVGAPISAAAYGFLALVTKMQGWIFTDLPRALGFHGEPLWWPIPPLVLAGLLVGLTIRYLPGSGGHSPADGFQAGEGPPLPAELPGVILAAFATLSLGVVLGPEAPLIALGGGLPGLVAAGIGSLIFLGLNAWTGLGTFSLAIPHLPHFGTPDIAEFGWALVIGAAAAVAGSAIRRSALLLRPQVERRMLLLTPAAGLAVAGLAIGYATATGKGSAEVLFSGQDALGPFVAHSAQYAVGALLLLVACKAVAYAVSLSSFRGGPIFPAMFVGAAGAMALSHLPGLPLVPALAVGIGAMSAAMLRLPMTSVLLPALLLAPDALAVTPLVIVAVVVAYVMSERLAPPTAGTQAEPAAPGEVVTSHPSGSQAS
jgi:H+/Cl- antiporter ClcA